MKVVLLAGGKGTRISEYSEVMPKPMVEIGGMPILWHIMKEYLHFGFDEFIICAGYKQQMIKKWFADYYFYTSDISFDFKNNNKMEIYDHTMEPWKVTIVNTGEDTMTGGRIKRIRKYVGDETFMMTYSDGVCDVDISKILDFHKKHGKLATLTSVIQQETKGTLDIGKDKTVRAFREKARHDSVAINAGYMVLEPAVFDYIDGDDSVFEVDVLEKLATQGELMSYSHNGFWQCMDTVQERNYLDNLWKSGKAPWKLW